MDEKILKVFSRLKDNGDGIEFIDYLYWQYKQSVNAMLGCESQRTEYMKGYCSALNELIKLFEDCDDKLGKLVPQEKGWL